MKALTIVLLTFSFNALADELEPVTDYQEPAYIRTCEEQALIASSVPALALAGENTKQEVYQQAFQDCLVANAE